MNAIARSCVVALALSLLAVPVACDAFSGEPHLHVEDGHAELSFSGAFLKEAFVFEDGYFVSPLLESPTGGTRVGFMLDVSDDAPGIHLEARAYDKDGQPGPWLPAVFTWAEAQARVARVDFPSVSYATEVRVPADEADALLAITYALLIPGEGARDVGFDALASQPLDIDVAVSPTQQQALVEGVNPRSAWNARSSNCSANPTKNRISVHHTATASTPVNGSYAGRIRQIQNFHIDSRGWCDIGYHYLITRDGQAWEGRPADRLGAHVANQNTNNLGVSFVGCFHPTNDCNGLDPTTPPDVMVQKGGQVIGLNAQHYGITLRTPSMSGTTTLMGHRDNPGASTACPGNNLHKDLDLLRTIALDAVSTPTPTKGTVQGVVWDLSVTPNASESQALGARLPGATVTVVGVTSTTAREGDAFWSFELDPGTYTLRATLDGFAPAEREVQVTAGGAPWASIGLAPLPTSATLTVAVEDVDTGAPIPNASVEVTGVDPAWTNAQGEVQVSVNAGALVIRVAAEGYEPAELSHTVAAGAEERVEVSLERILVEGENGSGDEGPGAGGAGQGKPSDPERVHLGTQTASTQVVQGCVCVAGGDSESGDPTKSLALASLLGLGLLWRRRRGR